ncbi:class I SAM-dependent methyltransferase [Methylobacterium sp. HMF5984]
MDKIVRFRREQALKSVRPKGKLGVELGPLNRPIILRSDGDVLYADHLSTEHLQAKYAAHDVMRPDADRIVDVDLVLEHQDLAEALGQRGPVDYIVASHVIEHLPDPIRWLQGLASALKADGILFLVVPDKRFTFDFRRTTSTTGDLVAHYLAGARIASPAQVFEHVARTVNVDPNAIWAGHGREPDDMFDGQLGNALNVAKDVSLNNSYHDVHCTVYTPYSFIKIFQELISMGLVEFDIIDILPTMKKSHEFYVTMQKTGVGSQPAMPSDLDMALHHELPTPKSMAAKLRQRFMSRFAATLPR